MKTILSHSRMTLICTRPVVCKGLRVYSCKPSLVMCALLTGCGFLIVMPRAEPRHTVCSRSVIMLRGGATVYSSWFVCLSDPAISSHSLKTKRWNYTVALYRNPFDYDNWGQDRRSEHTLVLSETSQTTGSVAILHSWGGSYCHSCWSSSLSSFEERDESMFTNSLISIASYWHNFYLPSKLWFFDHCMILGICYCVWDIT